MFKNNFFLDFIIICVHMNTLLEPTEGFRRALLQTNDFKAQASSDLQRIHICVSRLEKDSIRKKTKYPNKKWAKIRIDISSKNLYKFHLFWRHSM